MEYLNGKVVGYRYMPMNDNMMMRKGANQRGP